MSNKTAVIVNDKGGYYARNTGYRSWSLFRSPGVTTSWENAYVFESQASAERTLKRLSVSDPGRDQRQWAIVF